MAQEYTTVTEKDPSTDPGSVTSCDFTYMERRPWIRDWYLYGVMRAVYDVAVDIYTTVTSILAKLNQNCDGDPIAVAVCDGSVEIADSATTWEPGFSIVSTAGSVAANTFQSVTFYTPTSNTTNATILGQSVPPGVTLTFSGAPGRKNASAFAYTASATANIYILTTT